jgi:hypothetical protein
MARCSGEWLAAAHASCFDAHFRLQASRMLRYGKQKPTISLRVSPVGVNSKSSRVLRARAGEAAAILAPSVASCECTARRAIVLRVCIVEKCVFDVCCHALRALITSLQWKPKDHGNLPREQAGTFISDRRSDMMSSHLSTVVHLTSLKNRRAQTIALL